MLPCAPRFRATPCVFLQPPQVALCLAGVFARRWYPHLCIFHNSLHSGGNRAGSINPRGVSEPQNCRHRQTTARDHSGNPSSPSRLRPPSGPCTCTRHVWSRQPRVLKKWGRPNSACHTGRPAHGADATAAIQPTPLQAQTRTTKASHMRTSAGNAQKLRTLVQNGIASSPCLRSHQFGPLRALRCARRLALRPKLNAVRLGAAQVVHLRQILVVDMKAAHSSSCTQRHGHK